MALEPGRAVMQPEVEERLPWKALLLQEAGHDLSLEGCELFPDVHKGDPALECGPRMALALECGTRMGKESPVFPKYGTNIISCHADMLLRSKDAPSSSICWELAVDGGEEHIWKGNLWGRAEAGGNRC